MKMEGCTLTRDVLNCIYDQVNCDIHTHPVKIVTLDGVAIFLSLKGL